MSFTTASGIVRRLSIGRQTAARTRAAAGSGVILPRANMAPNFSEDGFGSQTILPSQQERVYRNGVGRGTIPYAGQLAPGAHTHFYEGLLGRQFSAGPTFSAVGVSAVAGPPGTFTRTAGSFLTDGFRLGMIVRCTGFTTTGVGNNGRNYRIIALTALVMTVTGLGNEAVVTKANETASVTIAAVGKVNWIPASGQVIPYYTVEDWLPDLAVPAGEVHEDCRVQQISIGLPPTGIATISTQMIGREVAEISAPYFTAPADVPNVPELAGVSGRLRLNGQDVGHITQLSFQMARQIQADANVGSKRVHDIIVGPLQVRGSGMAFLTDMSLFTASRAETEMEVMVQLTTSPAINADFLAFTFPRAKITTPQKSDGPLGIMQSFQLVPLENTVTGGGAQATTVMVQDSTLV